jgi:2'-5' RNA ligase
MRLFTAVDIPGSVSGRLTALVVQLRPLARLQWSSAEKFHITTKFIGEWPEERLTELITALAAIRSPSPIEVSVRGIDWFGGGRVLYAGVTPCPELAQLARATEDTLQKLGLPAEDRVFSPHLTLARNRDRANLEALKSALSKLPSTDFGDFRVSVFALYLSRGGKYTKLKEFSFT